MSRNHTTLLAELRTNPHLAVYKLVTANTIARGGITPLPPITGPRTPTTGGPKQLGGGITVVRNSRTRTTQPNANRGPNRKIAAALALGENLTHDILKIGMPDTLAAQATTITTVLGLLLPRHARTGLDRRGPLFAEAAARYVIHHCQPHDLQFAHSGRLRRWLLDPTEHEDIETPVDQTEYDTNLARRLCGRPRIVWTHHDGPRHGLLIDRLHPALRAGEIERDTWTHTQVATDLKVAAAYLAGCNANPDALLGVRVLTHRAPNAGIHFLPDFSDGTNNPVGGAHHRIGGCSVCTTKTVLPNTGNSDLAEVAR